MIDKHGIKRDKTGRFSKGHKFIGKIPKGYRKGQRTIKWKNCYCGKLFYTTWKNRNRKSCSDECRSKRLSEVNKKGVFLRCAVCKKKIWIQPHKIKSSKTKDYFCSQRCFWKYRKGKIYPNMLESLERGRHSQKGKPKFTEKMRKKQSIRKKKEWADLKMREKQMTYRTPEKLKKFREGHRKYIKENKGNLPIAKIRHRRVIDKIIPNIKPNGN